MPVLRARQLDWRGALPLGLILAFLLVMLLRDLQQPLLDRHSWRQVDTASFARGLAEGLFDLFHPRFLACYPDEFGIDGPVETEFNLYPLIVAGLYRLFGIREVLARLVSIAFALGVALWTYLLGCQYLDRPAGLLAALSLGLSPLYVFYGRSVQPESTVLFLSVGGLFFFTRWLKRTGWLDYGLAIVCIALAFLTKITSLYMGLPLLVAAWLKYRWRIASQWRLWLLGILVSAPALAYYLHAHGLYQQSGLTVYGISGGWPGSGKFDTFGQLLDMSFYRVIFTRLRGVILGNYGFLLFLAGLVIAPKRREELVLYAWLLAVGLFILVVAEGNRQHEYYQLPIVPVATLFVGKTLSALIRPGTLNLELIGGRRYAGNVLTALFLVLNLRSALSLLPPMYAQSKTLLEVAEAARRLTPAGQPVAILYDWARVPEVFYYAHRRGWALWLERTPEGEYGRLIVSTRQRTPSGWRVQERLEEGIERLELLRSLGASSLVVSLERGTREEFVRSPVGQALARCYRIVGFGEHWIVYDLHHIQRGCDDIMGAPSESLLTEYSVAAMGGAAVAQRLQEACDCSLEAVGLLFIDRVFESC